MLDQPNPTNRESRRDPRVTDAIRRFLRRRTSVGVAVLASAVTALAMLGALAVWHVYAQWRLGWIELTNDGPALTVQVLPETGDEPVGEPFHVIGRSILALPAGDYRLRVHGVGLLGRTYRFAVNRGETQAHVLSLDEGRLLGGEPVRHMNETEPREKPVPVPYAPITAAVELTPGKADLIACTGTAIIRRDGQTGQTIWDSSRPSIPWSAGDAAVERLGRWLEDSRMPALTPAAPDLDGDGTGDLVWVSRNRRSLSLMALSGMNGTMLWEHDLDLDLPGVNPPDDPQLPGPLRPSRRSALLAGTLAVADLDRDGTPDLAATAVFYERNVEVERRSPAPAGARGQAYANRPALARRMIQAVSGRTGRTLWSYPIDPTFTTSARLAWRPPATIVPGRKQAVVAFVYGTKWIALDPATGKPRGAPVDLGFEPVGPVQYADCDGDGESEILALGPGQSAGQQTIAAFSPGTARNLWITSINAEYPSFDHQTRPEWPLVVDLDGDGRSEIVVPDSGPMPPADGYRGVRVIDGQSGRTRWIRPMRPETRGDDPLEQILDAPDLDHDGVRDLITTSLFLGRYLTSPELGAPPVPERVYVDALSGADGHPFWWWHCDTPTDRPLWIRPLKWWGRGPDGWPLLAVPLGGQDPRVDYSAGARSALVHNLAASTGRAVSTAVGLNRVDTADFDGDGLADLWGEADGQIQAFRGEAPEAWRALGRFVAVRPRERALGAMGVVQPAADLDGDGIADALTSVATAPMRWPWDAIASHAFGPFLEKGFPRAEAAPGSPPGSRTLVARSGRDGRVIWKSELDPRRIWYERDSGESHMWTVQSLPSGDLDGDGMPEVLVRKIPSRPWPPETKEPATLPLQVVSGRAGRHLWSAGPLPLGFEAYGYSSIHWLEPRIVEPRTAPDVFVRHGSPFVPSRPLSIPAGAPTMSRLARVSGRDGRIVWDVPLSEHQDPSNVGDVPGPGFADLDGDGALDVLVAIKGAPTTDRVALKAISLHDGRLIWSLALDFTSALTTSPQLAVADLDADHRPEVVVVEQPPIGDEQAVVLSVLDGRDGDIRWTWHGGAAKQNPRREVYASLVLANFAGDGRRSVCLTLREQNGPVRIRVFSARGQERASRELPDDAGIVVGVADVNGDGRDELLVHHRNNLRVWTRDLNDLWSRPTEGTWTGQILPASPGRAGSVIIPPALVLNGSNGHPQSAGHFPQHWLRSFFTTDLLDPGNASRFPRFLTTGLGATICRSALPTTSTGLYARPSGAPMPPGLARRDPRWLRPLPWAHAVERDYVRSRVLVVIGLALFNVFLPLAFLGLAARRRPWTLRLMLALPIAAAVPLTAFVAMEPLIPTLPAPYPSSSRVLCALGSLAGIPIVSFAAIAGWSLVRRRWLPLALLASLTVLASVAIGLIWLWIDMRSMPAIEQYTWSGWYLAVLPGAYAAGLLMPMVWAISRWVRSRPIEALNTRA